MKSKLLVRNQGKSKKKGRRLADGTELPSHPKVKRAKLRPVDLLKFLLPALAVVVAGVVAWRTGRELTDYQMEITGYQYYGGGEFPIEAGTTLRHQNNVTTLVSETGNNPMSTLPIYMGENQALLACDMVYWDVNRVFQSRLPYYTQLRLDEHDQVIMTRAGDEITATGGFVYDGGDLYLFLEPVNVKFNGYDIYLPALSYVEVSATEDLMLYDYQWGEFYTETPRTGVSVRSQSGDFTLSLISDTVQEVDGVRQMLASQPLDLNSIWS